MEGKDKTMHAASITNGYGIAIRKICASCAYKEAGRNENDRVCGKDGTHVRPTDTCPAWKLRRGSDGGGLLNAGKGGGRVKRIEYLRYACQRLTSEEGSRLTPDELATEWEYKYGTSHILPI